MIRDDALAWFACSQAIAPIVPGTNTKRYESRRGSGASVRARKVATAMPERLSLASDGWQTCVEISTSSVRLARQEALAVGEVAVREGGVDADLVLAVLERERARRGSGRSPSPRW